MARVNGLCQTCKSRTCMWEQACTLPQFAATLANPTSVGQSSPGAGNLWGGGVRGPPLSLISGPNSIRVTIPTRVSSVAAGRAHRKPGLQGHTSDPHANWSPRAGNRRVARHLAVSLEALLQASYMRGFPSQPDPEPCWGTRSHASPEGMMGYSSGCHWT